MTDEERIAMATVANSKTINGVEYTLFHGPVERMRCTVHPRNTETFRWSWLVPSSKVADFAARLDSLEADGEVDYVRSCTRCSEELERELW